MQFFPIRIFYKNTEAEMAFHEWKSMKQPFLN